MTNFFDTIHCRSGVHCKLCRDRLRGGRRFREVMRERFDLPETDFDCPHGRPWGYEGSDTPAPVDRVNMRAFVARTRACRDCGDRCENGRACRRRDPRAVCPRGRWEGASDASERTAGVGE